MDDEKKTIGLTDLLHEVSRDLEDLCKKHTGDYQLKNVTMWWELEKERLLARHGMDASVKKWRRFFSRKSGMPWFFAGWLTMIVLQLALRAVIG